MVESSSDFQALSGCARVSFRTTWAFVVTWREVRYYSGSCDKVGTVHKQHVFCMYKTVKIKNIFTYTKL